MEITISLPRRIFPQPFLLSCFSDFFPSAWWLFQDDPWHLVSPCPPDTHWDLIFRENSAKSVETIEVGDKKCCCLPQTGEGAQTMEQPGGTIGEERCPVFGQHTQFFLSLFQILFQKMLLWQYGQRVHQNLQPTPFSWQVNAIKEIILLWMCSVVEQNKSLLICVDTFQSLLYKWVVWFSSMHRLCSVGILGNLSWGGRSPCVLGLGQVFIILISTFCGDERATNGR